MDSLDTDRLATCGLWRLRIQRKQPVILPLLLGGGRIPNHSPAHATHRWLAGNKGLEYSLYGVLKSTRPDAGSHFLVILFTRTSNRRHQFAETSIPPNTSKKRLQRMGIGTKLLCIVHCLRNQFRCGAGFFRSSLLSTRQVNSVGTTI